MRSVLRSLSMLAVCAGAASAQTPAPEAPVQTPIEVGAVAPDFTVPGATRYGVLAQPIKLSDFQGKTVVIAFFPRARTQGCTIQMRAYRDQYSELFRNGQDVVLIAMSTDSAEDLASWAKDEQFQFLMASDTDGAVATMFGASRGRVSNRFLYVIGSDGRVAHTQIPFQEVDPTAYEQLSAALDRVVVASRE